MRNEPPLNYCTKPVKKTIIGFYGIEKVNNGSLSRFLYLAKHLHYWRYLMWWYPKEFVY